MYHEQELGVVMLFIAIGFIIIGTCLQMWDNYPFHIAASLTAVYSTGFFIFAYTGLHTFSVFRLDYRVTKQHEEKDRGTIYCTIYRIILS